MSTTQRTHSQTSAGTEDQVKGKTIQWTFANGPTAGKTFEHRFNQDGSYEYRMLGGKSEEFTKGDRYASVKVHPDVYAVSYLGDAGYTLTTVLNFKDKRAVSFASNEKDWVEQHGTFEVMG
jgi:hypothetical protein